MSERVGRFLSPDAERRFREAYSEGMRLLPEPAGVHDVGTAFGEVRVYRFGSAPGVPLVLLHGTNGTTVSWEPNIEPLAQRRTVFSVDLLGEAGAGVQTAPIRNADDQAAWLDQTLEGLGLARAHLVGVSMGGWTACNLAVRRPQRVASATLLDPINTLARMPLGLILRTVPTLIPGLSRWATPRFLRYIDGQGTDPLAEPVGRVIDAAMRGYRKATPQPALFKDDSLRSLPMPVLAVVAGRSVIHDPATAQERARRLIPHVQAELWPEATHAISGQCADRVNERVLQFTAEVDSHQ
ncbi:alpha/beta fold hydrolase [Actinomadura sp. K4S16]|uniref:alpha/beta fold hydrolase n=1 Tax=Actinomadura sp. K4S16 TaxID=1316147 RepID=UPI0011ED27B5|nr:alpha/beta hydrolase [Actinomadura sp. K4S16]